MPNDIKHYGIKGMRWGIRKDRVAKGRASPPKASTLSDDELKDAVNRMNMEKNYNRLISESSGQQALVSGRKFVQDILSNAGKQAATNYLAGRFTKVITSVVEDRLGV